MKRALQGVLVAGEEMREDVLSGKKKITIREGHRDYTEGPVLIGCHLLGWSTIRNITSVTHKKLSEVQAREYKSDGFDTKADMLVGLSKFYPDINWESEITVIRWE